MAIKLQAIMINATLRDQVGVVGRATIRVVKKGIIISLLNNVDKIIKIAVLGVGHDFKSLNH